MGCKKDFAGADLESITSEELSCYDFREISYDFNEDFYNNEMRKFTKWFLTNAYENWDIIQGQENLEKIPKDSPVFFIATHREHSDYLIHAYMLYIQGWIPPERKAVKIAAGENLYLKLPHQKLPILNIEKWIRQAGAFQIYRTGNRTNQEKTVLQNRLALFVAKMVSENESILLYPDSGRAYSGASDFNPSAINMILTAQHITGKNICLVPMATSYELVPADRYFQYFGALKDAKEQRKLTLKEKTNYYLYDWPNLLFHAFKKDLGNAYTNIGEPIIIKAGASTPSRYQRGKSSIKLSRQLQKKCEQLVEVTATSLFCRALKKEQANGKVYLPNLIARITEERENLIRAGARASNVQDSEHAAERAISILSAPFRRMINCRNQEINAARQDVIDYYASNIAHFK